MSDIRFGPFVISHDAERLYRDGRQVRLGDRPRRLLRLLVERAGDVVTKRELFERVWGDAQVAESNLTVQITALRQALGEAGTDPRYIVNVPGRGYRFAATAETVSPAITVAPAAVHKHNLPSRLSPVIGREEDLARIATRLDAGPFMSLTGPAGVGKTTTAILVARNCLSRYPDGVWFVDLAPLSDPEFVPSAFAAALRVELPPGDQIKALASALGARRALVVLDNCEHLIDAVAALVAALVQACPTIKILATSREPLNITGEIVYRLPPLAAPPTTLDGDTDAILTYPAVRLLADRATASASNFELTPENAGLAAVICRRLDGVPLAIEFAAGLVETFGLAEIAGRLDEHLRLLQGDRRGGAARHRTLNAALEWSFQLLDDAEQTVLRRLSIFAGGFTLEAAEAVIPDPQTRFDLGEVLASLTLKSLLNTDTGGGALRFRVLETTRAFGLLRLEAAGERTVVAMRHARFFRDFLAEKRTTIERDPIGADAVEIDNIRTALRFSLGQDGDLDLALGLASGALPLWLGLSLLSECHARLKEVMPRLSPDQRASVEGWDVAVALRTAEMFTQGTARSSRASWARAPEGAGSGANSATSTADLLTNWTWNIRQPNYAEMSRLAGRHAAYARSSGLEHDRIMSAWVMGLSAHHLGDLEMARERLTEFLRIETIEDRRVFVSHTGFDRTPGAQAMLGATLCQMGLIEQGLIELQAGERIGREAQKAMPVCEALMYVCAGKLIAREDPADIERLLAELMSLSKSHGLDSHFGVGVGLLGVCRARAGDAVTAEELLAQAVTVLTASHYGPFLPWFTGVYALALARQGRALEGLAAVERFSEQDENGDSWCTPELRRAEAVCLAIVGRRDLAVQVFERAVCLARSQSSLAWEVALESHRERLMGPQAAAASLEDLLDRLSARGPSRLLEQLRGAALDHARDPLDVS
jgi:predicted ATPase/DNA-binding winged helix-turn-helix (wHTH) protein